MSIDVNALYVPSAQIQQAWSSPLQVLLGIAYLWYTLGYSAFVGVLVIALLVYFNYKAAKILERWQSAQMALKDERAKMVNEVLNGIKVVKLYAWEKPMEAHIEEIRRKELGLIKKAALLQNLLDVFVGISPFLVALCTFTTFVLISVQNRLTPQIAFVALTLFNQLRTNISAIRFVIDQLTMARVSYKRLKTFFDAEELASTVVDTDPTSPNSLEMKNLTTNWDMEMEKKTLEDVSLDVPRGQLIAVVGKVGSGKSSLIGALLGEMGKISGSVGVNGRLAYVPQQPWIQNMTVRENILFGKPFDKKRYNQVLGACALRTDLSILPHGEQTEIGEKGINLSGGQKARISLARAVYQDLDVYLLDDPLSAVDAHVGRHIFEKVLGPKGLLKNKTRLLVTHGLVYAKQADEIVVLEDGKIVERGAYSALISMDGRFTAFMEEYRADAKESGSGDKSEGDSFEDEKSEERPRCDSILETSPQNDDQKLIKEETMESGRVGKAVYHMYIRAASYWRCCLFVIFLVVFWIFQVARSFCLSEWSNLYEGNETDVNPVPYIAAYAAFGLVELISLLISFIFVVSYGLNASRNLHSPLIHSVLRSPMEFFDTTPLGRILNRCTNDIQTVDSSLPWNFRAAVSHIVQIIATVLIITIATPPFIVVIIPLAGIYYLILAYYVPTSRQLTRLQNTNRSPIFSHFEESLQGVTSIRAYDKKEDFRQNAGQIVDRFIRCKYMSVVSTRWLAVRLEFIGNLVVLCAALSAVFAKQFGWAESAGVVGVSISYALSITDVLNWEVRSISEIESNVVTVERIDEYTRNSAEAPWEMAEKRTDESWPSSGVVNFEKYSTRYRPGLDLVLKEISADVSSGEKIGIVGRTGAGKSSFALALFRLIEPAEGSILIDGVDVSRIGLHDLRSALTIIPQDPVLFSGTLRFNLDPFERCSDGEIWQALELAHLKDMASSFEKGLSHHISEGGENISVGQRQLVCLARALLRRTKILVLDEATAAVDVATDALIQATIRQQFNDCTVFTIAHRLNTILDYDRIMVLDKGEIAEMDSPAALLENKDSIFSRMVADSKTEESS